MMAVDLAAPLGRLRVLWTAFFLTVCTTVVVPFVVIDAGRDAAAVATPALVSGLHAGAVGAAVASFLVRKRLNDRLLAALAAAVPAPELWVRLLSACLVTWAISEAVAFLGVAIALVTRNPFDAIPFAGAALFLLYMHRVATWPAATHLTAAPPAP